MMMVKLWLLNLAQAQQFELHLRNPHGTKECAREVFIDLLLLKSSVLASSSKTQVLVLG